MNLLSESLGLTTIVGGWLGFVLLLVWSVKTAPWHKIDGDKGAQHVLLAVSVLIFLIWQLGVSLDNGITFHFLFMTLMTLMFGPQFAFLGMLLALIGVTYQSDLGWLSYGVNAILMGAVPIMITWGLYRIGTKFLEPSFFIYVLYNGFFSASVGVVFSLLLAGLIMRLNEVYSAQVLEQSFWVFIPMMATPEGFLNGMLLAVLVLLKPQWLTTFHDKTFLQGK